MDTTVLDKDFSLDGNRVLLNIIDPFSKYLYSFIVSGKTAAETLRSLISWCINEPNCVCLRSDNGTKFKNSEVKQWCAG
jgi:hypothetical protein